MAKRKTHSWLKRQEWIPWLIAAITVLSANWAADATWKTFEVWANWELGVFSWARTWPVVLFMIMAFLFYWKKNDFFPPRTKHLSRQKTKKRKHLVLFLSNLHHALETTGGLPKSVKLTNDIHKDIKMLGNTQARRPANTLEMGDAFKGNWIPFR